MKSRFRRLESKRQFLVCSQTLSLFLKYLNNYEMILILEMIDKKMHVDLCLKLFVLSDLRQLLVKRICIRILQECENIARM